MRVSVLLNLTVDLLQDLGKSSVCCPFQRKENEVYIRIGTQGSNTADRSHHLVSPAYTFAGWLWSLNAMLFYYYVSELFFFGFLK